MQIHPVLYSYRRCPYAMRARMAIYLSGLQVEQREIVFWEKPPTMLEASPKGTVPVLVLPDGSVIDESRDIMLWALRHSQNTALYADYLRFEKKTQYKKLNEWIDCCDDEFKTHLDHYKYSDRFPEFSQEDYRERGCEFLQRLEQQLSLSSSLNVSECAFLLGDKMSLADIALFPFIRQFVNVDKVWFVKANYPYLKAWLSYFIESTLFKGVMKNRPVWQEGDNPLWVDEPSMITKDEFVKKARS